MRSRLCDHFTVYTNLESLCCTSETNVMYVLYFKERVLKKYYEQFCAHQFDNLDEMAQFLESYNPSKVTQGEILNRPVSIKEIFIYI